MLLKRRLHLSNGVLVGNQGQENVGSNLKGGEIVSHLGLRIENKEESISLNGEILNLEDRVEKLGKCENGASISDVVYFRGHFIRDTRIPLPW